MRNRDTFWDWGFCGKINNFLGLNSIKQLVVYVCGGLANGEKPPQRVTKYKSTSYVTQSQTKHSQVNNATVWNRKYTKKIQKILKRFLIECVAWPLRTKTFTLFGYVVCVTTIGCWCFVVGRTDIRDWYNNLISLKCIMKFYNISDISEYTVQ